MGIEYAAAIIVGLPVEDFPGMDNFYDWMEDNGLERCPPSYDADHGIVGLFYKRSTDYGYDALSWDQSKLEQLKEDFKEITGMEARVYLSTLGM